MARFKILRQINTLTNAKDSEIVTLNGKNLTSIQPSDTMFLKYLDKILQIVFLDQLYKYF